MLINWSTLLLFTSITNLQKSTQMEKLLLLFLVQPARIKFEIIDGIKIHF